MGGCISSVLMSSVDKLCSRPLTGNQCANVFPAWSIFWVWICCLWLLCCHPTITHEPATYLMHCNDTLHSTEARLY